MDRAILDIDGMFYARYNDDFLFAHPELDAMHEADSRIDSLTAELGVKRKMAKERRTALSGNGRPRSMIRLIGAPTASTTSACRSQNAGTTAVAPSTATLRRPDRHSHRRNGPALHPLAVEERAATSSTPPTSCWI